MKTANTFNIYKSIRKNAAKVLISSGVPARTALDMIRENMSYLFMTKSECSALDTANKLHPIS